MSRDKGINPLKTLSIITLSSAMARVAWLFQKLWDSFRDIPRGFAIISRARARVVSRAALATSLFFLDAGRARGALEDRCTYARTFLCTRREEIEFCRMGATSLLPPPAQFIKLIELNFLAMVERKRINSKTHLSPKIGTQRVHDFNETEIDLQEDSPRRKFLGKFFFHRKKLFKSSHVRSTEPRYCSVNLCARVE